MAKKLQPLNLSPAMKAKLRRRAPVAPRVPRTLTAKEQRFVEEYCLDLNATQAAIRAGYSKASASSIGSATLRKARIAAAITAWRAQMASQARRTREDMVAELERMGFASLLDYYRVDASGEPHIDLSAVTRDQAAALIELTVDDYVDGRGEDARDVKKTRIRVADKKGALELLAKLHGWLKEKVELEAGPGLAKQLEQRAREDLRTIDDPAVLQKIADLEEQKAALLASAREG